MKAGRKAIAVINNVGSLVLNQGGLATTNDAPIIGNKAIGNLGVSTEDVFTFG